MQEKTPGKTKKQEIFITFLQMWTIFPQNPGKLTKRVRDGKQQASGNPEACCFWREKEENEKRGVFARSSLEYGFSVSPKVKNNLEKF